MLLFNVRTLQTIANQFFHRCVLLLHLLFLFYFVSVCVLKQVLQVEVNFTSTDYGVKSHVGNAENEAVYVPSSR
jgi:hypothetical protein